MLLKNIPLDENDDVIMNPIKDLFKKIISYVTLHGLKDYAPLRPNCLWQLLLSAGH